MYTCDSETSLQTRRLHLESRQSRRRPSSRYDWWGDGGLGLQATWLSHSSGDAPPTYQAGKYVHKTHKAPAHRNTIGMLQHPPLVATGSDPVSPVDHGGDGLGAEHSRSPISSCMLSRGWRDSVSQTVDHRCSRWAVLVELLHRAS